MQDTGHCGWVMQKTEDRRQKSEFLKRDILAADFAELRGLFYHEALEELGTA